MSDTDYNRLWGNNITGKFEKRFKQKIDKETWNVTLAGMPLSPLKIKNQTFEITPNAD